MTTSGTTTFQVSEADAVIQAFARCGVKRPAFTPEHMIDARLCSNLLLMEWENSQPHLWKVDEAGVPFQLPLIQGQATYELPAETILCLDVYISSPMFGGDRIMYPESRSNYASYPNKDQQGVPTIYWFARQEKPTITFYQTPDGNGPYTANIYRVTQFEDVNLKGAETPDVVRRFLPAYIAGLAARLSETYAPERYDTLEMRHKERFDKANIADQENGALSILPELSSYYR